MRIAGRSVFDDSRRVEFEWDGKCRSSANFQGACRK